MTRSRKDVLRRISGWLVTLVVCCAIPILFAACNSGEDTDEDTPVFPTGRFLREDKAEAFEWDEDGTYSWFMDNSSIPGLNGRYGISGNYYTEMTHNYAASPKIPATYKWTFDGERLTFELWGRDMISSRQATYDGQTFIKVE